MAAKASAPKTTGKTTPVDPTSNEALKALDVAYAEAPDIPVEVARKEWESLHRLASTKKGDFAKIGIGPDKLDCLAGFAKRLGLLEKQWQKARQGVSLTPRERKLLAEAETLDAKLVAGGRWGCRKDPEALKELSRIAEGSGVADTRQDLMDEVAFWGEHESERASTRVTDADLRRAGELANELRPAAEKEANNLNAAEALDLRNRCFWAGEEVAKEVREGGRYAFHDSPKIAVKFASRYRTTAVRKSRRKAKDKEPPQPPGNPADPNKKS